jgi:hypothetical protein
MRTDVCQRTYIFNLIGNNTIIYRIKRVSQTQQQNVTKQYCIMLAGLHVSTLSHLQALKAQIHIVNEQCIVGSPTLTIYKVNNNENAYVTVPMVYNNRLSNRI